MRIAPCKHHSVGNLSPTLHWRHNDHGGVSNHQPRGCLLNRLFRHSSKKTSKLHITGLCAGNSPGPVNSPHKGPVTRKMFPFDDVIMIYLNLLRSHNANKCPWNVIIGSGNAILPVWYPAITWINADWFSFAPKEQNLLKIESKYKIFLSIKHNRNFAQSPPITCHAPTRWRSKLGENGKRWISEFLSVTARKSYGISKMIIFETITR